MLQNGADSVARYFTYDVARPLMVDQSAHEAYRVLSTATGDVFDLITATKRAQRQTCQNLEMPSESPARVLLVEHFGKQSLLIVRQFQLAVAWQPVLFHLESMTKNRYGLKLSPSKSIDYRVYTVISRFYLTCVLRCGTYYIDF